MTRNGQFSHNGRELCGFAPLRENHRYQMPAPAFPQRRKGAKKSENENRNDAFLDLFRVLSCDFVVKNSEEMNHETTRNHTSVSATVSINELPEGSTVHLSGGIILRMSIVGIEDAIRKLSPDKVSELMEWFAKYHDEIWMTR